MKIQLSLQRETLFEVQLIKLKLRCKSSSILQRKKSMNWCLKVQWYNLILEKNILNYFPRPTIRKTTYEWRIKLGNIFEGKEMEELLELILFRM